MFEAASFAGMLAPDLAGAAAGSPEAMMQAVWRRPSVASLRDIKDCLDFGATSWLALFARLGGADLLQQVTREP